MRADVAALLLLLALAGCSDPDDRAIEIGPGRDDLKRSPCADPAAFGRRPASPGAATVPAASCAELPQLPGPIEI